MIAPSIAPPMTRRTQTVAQFAEVLEEAFALEREAQELEHQCSGD